MIIDDTSPVCGWPACSKAAARSVTFEDKIFHGERSIEPLGKYFRPVRRNLCTEHLARARGASLISNESELNPQWDAR